MKKMLEYFDLHIWKILTKYLGKILQKYLNFEILTKYLEAF